MTREPFSSNLWIKTDRYYLSNELFVLFKENFGDKFPPIDIKKFLNLEKIYFQGANNYSIYVWSTKWGVGGKGNGRIIVSQDKKFLQILKDSIPITILCVLTLGIGFIIWRIVDKIKFIFGLEGTKASRAKMRELAGEIENLGLYTGK
jgi:hypothetical protein